MRIDILTLFPDTLGDVLSESILGRAQERGFIRIEAHQIRDYTANKQNQVDDYPYGGGRGAVMTADPLYRCWEAVCDEAGGPVHTIYMSPCGHTFKQADAIRLSKMENIIIVCGHYEGIDQRFIDECVDEEISLGDFVLTGGEIAAMAVTDAVCRMVPGVLADPECFEDESHYNGLLEYPQYTRPAVWHGREIQAQSGSGISSWPSILYRSRYRVSVSSTVRGLSAAESVQFCTALSYRAIPSGVMVTFRLRSSLVERVRVMYPLFSSFFSKGVSVPESKNRGSPISLTVSVLCSHKRDMAIYWV